MDLRCYQSGGRETVRAQSNKCTKIIISSSSSNFPLFGEEISHIASLKSAALSNDQGRQSWRGWGGHDPQILDRRVRRGGRGWVVEYYILSCIGSMFEM